MAASAASYPDAGTRSEPQNCREDSFKLMVFGSRPRQEKSFLQPLPSGTESRKLPGKTSVVNSLSGDRSLLGRKLSHDNGTRRKVSVLGSFMAVRKVEEKSWISVQIASQFFLPPLFS